jgi:hypothetical protein
LDIIQTLLNDIPIQRMVKIRQSFPAPKIEDVSVTLQKELDKPVICDQIRPGMRIAIAVGSRGVAELPALVRITVDEIKKLGGEPFIVPSMGSHGGATEEGQVQVLENLGVTEESAGCPILSSMEVVEIGRLQNGLPVYVDSYAHQADGIVVINRIKPHTAFRGKCESGLVKMITIGLGKQKGAEACHIYSFKHMAENLLNMAKISLERLPILFGVGTVENAYDQIAKIVAVPARELVETDSSLLLEAKANMPKILFDQIDVLVIDQIGKDISGDGMDPNITGRYPTKYATGGPEVVKMVVLDLTERSHGNANGMGTADFTTQRLVNKTNFKMTYANGLTSTVVGPTHMPTVLDSDRDALRAAIKTCNAWDMAKVRVVRIHNTLALGEIYISEAMLEEAKQIEGISILSEPFELVFDEQGNLTDL